VIDRMMAKRPEDRYPTPQAVAEALTPWTGRPIPPPSADEIPKRNYAAGAQGNGPLVPTTPLPPRVMPSSVLNRPPAAGSGVSRPTGRPSSPSPAPRPSQAGVSKNGTKSGVVASKSGVRRLPQKRVEPDRFDWRSPILLYGAGGAGAALVLLGVLWFLF